MVERVQDAEANCDATAEAARAWDFAFDAPLEGKWSLVGGMEEGVSGFEDHRI